MADPITLTEEQIKERETTAAVAAVAPIQKALDEAKEELKKFEGKDLNFGQLRTQKEEAENKVKEIEGKLTTAETTRVTEVREAVFDGLVGQDAETRKKILEERSEEHTSE